MDNKQLAIISAAEAARIIGCNPTKVREHIKRGVWTFGERVPAAKLGRKSDEYLINRAKLMAYLEGRCV